MEYKRCGFTRPLPEARAVMEAVHRRPLDLYMGLHNSNFSGAYFYLSAEDAVLQDELAALLCTRVAVRERYRPAHPRPFMARIAL
jgi:hypothetical protein